MGSDDALCSNFHVTEGSGCVDEGEALPICRHVHAGEGRHHLVIIKVAIGVQY